MTAGSNEEISLKRERLLGLMARHGLDGAVLTSLAGIAWFTGGADLHVAWNTSEAVGALLVTGDRLCVVTGASETARLKEEELAGSPVEVMERPWHEPVADRVEQLARAARLGTDDRGLAAEVLGAVFLGPEIADLRHVLTPWEVDRYREVGRLTGASIEDAARAIVPEMTEWQVAAMLDKALLERGVEPTVTLIAADDRIRRFRHPIPTDNRIERCCMLITCARKYGLIAAATRIVHFGPLPGDLRRRHQATVEVEAAAIASSRPGATMGELYDVIASAYAASGYPGEERLHHQGGAIGYENREYLAAPGSSATIHAPQAFAWNPTVTGTKSEDTYLVLGSDARQACAGGAAPHVECLTAGDGSWPVIEVTRGGLVLPRPDILVL
ncbi:MAG: M24 family metallopeptidase [Bacteroidota bacterium]